MVPRTESSKPDKTNPWKSEEWWPLGRGMREASRVLEVFCLIWVLPTWGCSLNGIPLSATFMIYALFLRILYFNKKGFSNPVLKALPPAGSLP